jgi:sugar phosphate isomerase/epimerase
MIKYGLNGSTTMPLDQATEIRQVAAAGFDLIEFRAPKIEQFLQTGALAELKQLLDDTGLEPLSINSIEKLQSRPAAELLVECEQHAAWAQGLGCPYIIAVPGFLSEPVPPQEAIARTVDALAPLAEIAGAHNLHLGFEFLGAPTPAWSSTPSTFISPASPWKCFLTSSRANSFSFTSTMSKTSPAPNSPTSTASCRAMA